MRLTLINGSPRGTKSNTTLLLNAFVEGFQQTPGHTVEVHHLAVKGGQEAATEAFGKAEVVVLAFPLYSDSMPSIVKTFIESLEPLQGKKGNPSLAFLVQCGFPEALHLRTVERYLVRLVQRLDSPYLGAMVRGGVEGIQIQPPWMTKKLYSSMRQFGADLGGTGALDAQRLRKFSGTERYTGLGQAILRLVIASGIPDSYWNNRLKKNGTFAQRMDAPYR